LDPHFKLTHIADKDDILNEIQKHMMMEIRLALISTSSTVATKGSQVQSTANGSSESCPVLCNPVSSATPQAFPPSKKAKVLRKMLSRCLGNAEVQLTPQQRVKQEIDQYLTHPQLSMEGELLP